VVVIVLVVVVMVFVVVVVAFVVLAVIVAYRKADFSFVCSNMHYYPQKHVQLLSLLLMN
jgi:hypothetical protein